MNIRKYVIEGDMFYSQQFKYISVRLIKYLYLCRPDLHFTYGYLGV